MPDPNSIDRRVWVLERECIPMRDDIKANSARLDAFDRRESGRTEWEKNMVEDVSQLKKTLDRLTWAIVATGLTLAGSMVGLAMTIASGTP